MKRRGFALLLVLALLTVVGALVWQLGAWSKSRASETARDVRRAQIEQLLLAAADFAPEVLRGAQTHLEPALPKDLDARLSLERIPGTTKVRAVVTCWGAEQEQVMRFAQEAGQWRLVAMEP